MISFEQALHTVLDAADSATLFPEVPCERTSLAECCGRVLQQEVYADRDTPPFNKSAVDGYACIFADLEQEHTMRLLEVIPAGREPKHSVKQGCCSKVMTGAMVPQGAECVLMVEDSFEENGAVRSIGAGAGKLGRKTNICLKGEDLAAQTLLLSSGTLLKSQHIAMLAAYGYTELCVSVRPKVGIISTGDELVEPDVVPSSVQIRNSNGWQLLSQSKEAGALATYYGIAQDHPNSLAPLLAISMKENNVVILSGGVSMGDFDIVPDTARRLGINILFDRVAVQPGKPTTFGVGKGCYFFGLPGNPVSSFVQFELMVKPFIMKFMGAQCAPVSLRLPLSRPYTRKQSNRMAHLPASIDPSGCSCSLIDYHGSGHITALDRAQCLVRIPVGVTSVAAGESVEIILL